MLGLRGLESSRCARTISSFVSSPLALLSSAPTVLSIHRIPLEIVTCWGSVALLSRRADTAAPSSATPGPALDDTTASAGPPGVSTTNTAFPPAKPQWDNLEEDDQRLPSDTAAVPYGIHPQGSQPTINLAARVLRDLRPPTQPYQLAPKLAQRPTPTPALYTPWTPTRALKRRSLLTRRMGFLMDVLEREQEARVNAARPLPDFRAGDVLEVRVSTPEAERKVAIYRGVCIARYDKGLRSTFKIYNVYPDCGGVVHHLPLYMPDLLGIKVVGKIPSSQERLFYLLERESPDYTFQTGVITVK